MRVTIGDKTFKISFKHISRFKPDIPPEPGEGPRDILLPAANFGLGGKKKFRGMTMCYIAVVSGENQLELVAEGRALCDEQDQYRKEDGRQWSLLHALKIKRLLSIRQQQEINLFGSIVSPVTRIVGSWELTEESPFDRTTTGQLLSAYFGRPHTKPNLADLVEKRAVEIVESLKQTVGESVLKEVFEGHDEEEGSSPPLKKEVKAVESQVANAGE